MLRSPYCWHLPIVFYSEDRLFDNAPDARDTFELIAAFLFSASTALFRPSAHSSVAAYHKDSFGWIIPSMLRALSQIITFLQLENPFFLLLARIIQVSYFDFKSLLAPSSYSSVPISWNASPKSIATRSTHAFSSSSGVGRPGISALVSLPFCFCSSPS